MKIVVLAGVKNYSHSMVTVKYLDCPLFLLVKDMHALARTGLEA